MINTQTATAPPPLPVSRPAFFLTTNHYPLTTAFSAHTYSMIDEQMIDERMTEEKTGMLQPPSPVSGPGSTILGPLLSALTLPVDGPQFTIHCSPIHSSTSLIHFFPHSLLPSFTSSPVHFFTRSLVPSLSLSARCLSNH
jgi:hypothetical protein